MTGKDVADQFITRGGRTRDYGRDHFVNDLIDVSSFLLWAQDDGKQYAGVEANDAFRALCRLLDIDVVGLRKAIMGDHP